MFEFGTEEQNIIRQTTRKLALQSIPPYQSNAHQGQLPRALFKSLANIGLAGLAIDEGLGGIQAGAETTMIVMEELAAVDLGPAIFVSVHAMASGLIQRFGSKSQRESHLIKMSNGEWLGAFALTEPAAGSDAANLKTEARPTTNGFTLNGEKCYITSAGSADIYIVFARTDKNGGSVGISAFIVPADAAGLSVAKPEKKMGCELSPIASVKFDQVKLPKEALLGELNGGYKIALSGLSGGRINIAACANGISRTAIALAVKHLQSREQFNEKLMNFQGLQFMLADMHNRLEASRLMTWQAARELNADRGSKKVRLWSSSAKCFATDAAMAITTDAVQLLGGAGYIADYQVERLMREAKMLQIVEGTNQIQRILIAREMQEEYLNL